MPPSTDRRRVAVTGMGAVTPVGVGVDAAWESLRTGRSGIGPVTRFDASALSSRIAGEVRDFDAAALLGVKEARRSARHIHFAQVAAREAVAQSCLDIAAIGDNVGVCIGSGVGGLDVIEQATLTLEHDGPRRVSPFAAAAALVDMAGGVVAIDLGARGPNVAMVSACATGADSLGQAAAWIERGDADVVIAGGTEAGITSTGMAMFAAARALSTRNDEPERASRPFDRDRDGFVAAEGAAVVVLEALDHATARGATVIAEVLGYAATADAHHITAPDPTASGAARCITRALSRAGVTPAELGYVNAHGTGTELNDISETRALHAALGDAALTIPVSSTKSMTGHLLGAAGTFEAIVCMLAMRDGWLPPTINLEHPAEGCDLDYVPLVGRVAHPVVTMSTSFGFGGHNACLVLGKPRPD